MRSTSVSGELAVEPTKLNGLNVPLPLGPLRRLNLGKGDNDMQDCKSSSRTDLANMGSDSSLSGSQAGSTESLSSKLRRASTTDLVRMASKSSMRSLKSQFDRLTFRRASSGSASPRPGSNLQTRRAIFPPPPSTIEALLEDNEKHAEARAAFHEFVRKEHSEENLLFYEACSVLESGVAQGGLSFDDANYLVEVYVVDGGEHQINIPGPVKQRIYKAQAEEDLEKLCACLVEAKGVVLAVLQQDSYARFLNKVTQDTVGGQ
eukprot:comp85975_c0_seq1/m.48453 comp85975_c0_seq1/g.48453  ORF comp85975_c0_seq1/g.48453 comp85975_c0_seq1/m.48453 type:complete len:262 (-) comp85975_c0_seq1:736-1521(-)